MRMRPRVIGIILLGVIAIAFSAWAYLAPPSKEKVRQMARRASVQPMFYLPVMRVAFVEHEPGKEMPVSDIIDEKIKEALETERNLREMEADIAKSNHYEGYLTGIEQHGYEPPSRTEIPIGSLPGVPKHAKFPKKVLVVQKIENSEVDPNKEEFDDDVQVVSETANVSISIAKDIMNKLRTDGYTISKDEVKSDATVELLHFDDGWDDNYPVTLSWTVTVEGSEDNIITGYDSRGILRVKPIPEKGYNDISRISVVAGYYDLKSEFKPVPKELQKLRDELEEKEKEIESLEERMADMVEVEEFVRDIRTANIFDVMSGRVTLDQFWSMSGGSGLYLGDYDFGEDPRAYHSRYYGLHIADSGMSSLILTNAHVAENAIKVEYLVSEDLSVMYIILPGIPFVRYTPTSDRLGSPAALLMYDGVPMMSAGVDAGIMVTTAIPGYDVHAANLGNSDNVRVGDGVISVGNPMLMSKFTTQGIVSQTNYNLFQSPAADFIFNYIRSGSQYDAWVNDNFWIDTTIGIGGVSGSGVWALQGPEQGKVVALRNAGLQSRNKMMLISESREVEPDSMPYDFVLGEITEKTAEKYFEDLFGDYPHTDARYTELVESSEFGEIYKQSGYSRVSGMNIGIPINRIKQFLQERGIDPSKLGWEPVSENYWE